MTRTLSPIEVAQRLYADRELRWEAANPGEQWPHRTFVEDLDEHMRNGIVQANTLFFVMAKAVDLNGRWCWLVQFAVGPIFPLLKAMPFYLPHIAFARKEQDKIRIYKTESILRIAKNCHSFYEFKPSNYGGFVVTL